MQPHHIAISTEADSPPSPRPEEVIATLRLAQFQLQRGQTWSASEILDEAIRELSGLPLQLQ
jgi:hypothetical protein